MAPKRRPATRPPDQRPPTWTAPDLRGKVALVTGASRGGGKGIALALGACGATVYVTARSVRGGPTPDGMPGTIEDTAAAVTARGGQGLAVRCDHTSPGDVEALVQRIRREQGGLDLLVNNAWGGYEGEVLMPAWFWNTPFDGHWRGMVEGGLKAQMLTAHRALPLMLDRPGGLVVGTMAWDRDRFLGGTYDVAKHAVRRFYQGLAMELKAKRIASIAVAPGFMRTERVLAAFKTDETGWRDVPELRHTETPEYVGRAIAHLASDRKVMALSGQAFRAGDLARRYGFRDVDGRRVPPFALTKSYATYVREAEAGTFRPG